MADRSFLRVPGRAPLSGDWLPWVIAGAGVCVGVGVSALTLAHCKPDSVPAPLRRLLGARSTAELRTGTISPEDAGAIAAASERLRAAAERGVRAVLTHTLSSTDTPIHTYTIPRVRDLIPDEGDSPTYPSPLLTREWPRNKNFVSPGELCITAQASGHPVRALPLAGPLQALDWDPRNVRAAIVTCGGLCPGLNTVIREIVMALNYVYKVPAGRVFGIPNGYRGFYEGEWMELTPEVVGRIHTEGGTVLGSSRGGFDAAKILDAMDRKGVDLVFIIGGDGTHRGALALYELAAKRGRRLSVACIPKTIDNDIALLDRSFGVQTAVEQAVHPINCAHTEALAAKNGVGLVKLMGRASGFIALYASMASRDVNVTLLPEADWSEAELCAYVESRVAARNHCVIVVAEGAQSLEQKARAAAAELPPHPASGGEISSTPAASVSSSAAGAGKRKTDESGNPILDDIGVYIKDVLTAHFKRVKKPLNLKYIDPSYIIRSSPANASDSDMCTSLAFNAVHGAMAGLTGFTVGLVDNMYVWLPISEVANSPPRRVDTDSRMYARLCTSTGQPCLAPLAMTGSAAAGSK